MKQVVMEIFADGWRPVASVSDQEPPGSFSSWEIDGRRVFVGPGVWRSLGPVDTEEWRARKVMPFTVKQVADLAQGPHEMTVTRVSGESRLRLRVEEIVHKPS